jgi:hypothetical protein
VLPPELPRAGLLLAAFGDFFLVASSCPTKHSRILKKNFSVLAATASSAFIVVMVSSSTF